MVSDATEKREQFAQQSMAHKRLTAIHPAEIVYRTKSPVMATSMTKEIQYSFASVAFFIYVICTKLTAASHFQACHLYHFSCLFTGTLRTCEKISAKKEEKLSFMTYLQCFSKLYCKLHRLTYH